MTIREYQKEYAIREFVLRKEERQITLEWSYQEGTHFLIFLYDRGLEFSPQKAKERLDEAGITDEQIIRCQSGFPAYRAENGEVQIFCLRKDEFLRAHRKFMIVVSGVGVCEISVYACAYDPGAKELNVYRAQGQENIQAVPVEVRYHIQYKKGFLFFKKKCILQLPVLEGYHDGALMYHVSGMAGNIDIPLPRTCLGRRLYITMPDQEAEVTVRVQEAYRKYYRLT